MVDEDRAAEQTRVADLSKRIAEFESRQQEERRYRKAKLPTGGMALAGRVTTELVAGVVVGTFIGWAFDNWLGTMNVWRALTGRGMAAGFVNEKSLRADENKADEQNNGRD